MGRGASAKKPAAAAVASVLDGQRREDDNTEAKATERHPRRQSGNQRASGVDDSVVARLTAQAAGQQSALLSRLVSRDPTTKARAHEFAAHARVNDGVKPQEVTETRDARHSRRGEDRAITVDEFDQKYATHDPMLHYLLDVIRDSRSVTRADIPRHPERLVDAAKRLAVPEEDVLFLAYHRHPPCGFRNVYWLEFISEDRAIDDEFEYFALSHHGLTHYRGSNVVDFVDVDSWVLEKRAFDHMTAMRGLQKLQGLLFFMSWKKKAIRMKHHRVRDRIACSLFQCDLTASRLLLGIRGCCVEIEQLAASHHLATGTTYMLDHIHQHNRSRLKFIRLKIHQQVDTMCTLIEREVLLLQQQREAEVEAEKQNYARVSRSSRLLDRLYIFLRLLDFHLFESLSTHMTEFIANLHVQVCGDNPSQRRELSHEFPKDQTSFCSETPRESIIPIQLPVGVGSSGASTVSHRIQFCLRHRATPSPLLFAEVVDNISPGSSHFDIEVSVRPAQVEVFDVIYGLLSGYVAALDGIPRLVSDRRFSGVLAPYTPQNRDLFIETLLKPSTQLLQGHPKDMKQMKTAIETYYKQLEIHTSDLVRLAADIYAADAKEVETKASNEKSAGTSSKLLTAAQYEEIHGVWGNLLLNTRELSRFVQIGILLLDQSSLLNRLEGHVIKRMTALTEELPRVYKQFLCDLITDGDGRMEKIMNIPTSIQDAIQWLKEMIEMMPTQVFRKVFDAKCANLVRLKQLLRDSGAMFPSAEEREYVKKKEYEWESMYETLITCFVRVQDRDSEHRRSVIELNCKSDECAAAQLDEIKHEFSQLPSHIDEQQFCKRKTKELAQKKQAIIDRLEQLVTVDGEREQMLELYCAFEIEHRLFTDQTTFESTEVLAAQKWAAKSPSELLLQHISAVFDVRAWFGAWTALEGKWLDTPLINTHPSMVLNRLKQFRRRLQFAAARLLPMPSVILEEEYYIARDHSLVQDLEARVDQMTSDYVIFHAATCGAFSSGRWQLCQGMLGMERVDHTAITLRMVKAGSATSPGTLENFKEICEVVVIESMLRSAAERLRQRMIGCLVIVWTTNLVVRMGNVQEVVLELDDIEVEAKLLRQATNPSFEAAITLHGEISERLLLCSRLQAFQGVWEDLCRLSRVHDIDEFFTGQVAWKGPVQRQKKKLGRDESTWGDFIEVAEDWAERLHRLACISQSSISQEQSSANPRSNTPAHSKLACSLDDVQEAFSGFDFELGVARCELAHQLVDKYLAAVREQCPRLYCLSKEQLIQLLVQDDNIATIRRALSVCYPTIPSFSITRGRKEDQLQEDGPKVSTATAGENSSSFNIRGITGAFIDRDFSVPVVKVGRLRFWLTRLDEEMGNLVTEDAKAAVATAWLWAGGTKDMFDSTYYQGQLPQSVYLAFSLRFTSTVVRALWSLDPEEPSRTSMSDNLLTNSTRLVELHTNLLHDVVTAGSTSGVNRNDVRFESMVLLLQYQVGVAQGINKAVQAGRVDEAEFMWNSQVKVDFAVEDLSAKTARRVRVCDAQSWVRWAMLGPSFPVTFLASAGLAEFSLGREMIGVCRTPVITPLTQRCFFEILKALRDHSLPLIAPVNVTGRGGHSAIMHGIAQMLVRLSIEISCSSSTSIHGERLPNLLKCVAATGSFLSIRRIDALGTASIRIIVEKINQLRQDQRQRGAHGNSMLEQRAAIAPEPSGCIFVPLHGNTGTANGHANGVLLRTSTDAFHPVAVILPSLVQFTRTATLLAGYQLAEVSKFQAVVTFFESFAQMDLRFGPSSSTIYRFIIAIMHDVSRFRSSFRVLLPSTGKWSSRFPGATSRQKGQRQMSKLFRRSVNADEVSDVVIDTLFYQALTIRYKGYLCTPIVMESGLSSEVTGLIERCFPLAQGCDLVEKATQTQEQALWDAMEMSLTQAGVIPNVMMLEKMLELFDSLQASLSIVVVGLPGVGKSLCVRTLHHALQALEVAEVGGDDSAHLGTRNASQLLFISSRFLFRDGHDVDDRTKHLLDGTFKSDTNLEPNSRRWLCIDGIVDPTRAEPFVHHYTDAEGQYPTSAHLVSKPRIILETTSLEHSSPAFLVRTRIHHVPQLLSSIDVVASWRESWTKKLPFAEDSKGFENVQFVLRLTEHLITGPVFQFAATEEATSLSKCVGDADDGSHCPTHLGMLSMSHLTVTCLQLVASTCFAHRSHLEERLPAHLARLIGFCTVWGFAGHLTEHYRQKLDQQVCPALKQFGEARLAGEAVEGVYESEHLGNGFWESIQLPLRGIVPPEAAATNQARSSVCRVIVDSKLTDRILVLPNAMLSLFRVLRLLVHSTTSIMIIGPRGSGKSSLLRCVWAMNVEDQAAEALVDASLDHRFAPDSLNWQDKPRGWFDRPKTSSATTSQHCPKAIDEALLFATYSAGAAKFVFVDDVAMPSDSNAAVVDMDPMGEFVRVAVDHKMGINWTNDRIMPLSKQFATSITAHLSGAPKLRVPHQTERLLRHFSVFRMPAPGRESLQGLFRQVYSKWFTTSTGPAQGATAAPSRIIPSSERALSLSEVVLRASVDLAAEVLALQQTTEHQELIDGFTFNLHHLSEVLSRSFSFIGVMVAANGSSVDSSGGATLLSLGKLYQCWITSVRHVFLSSCAYRAPERAVDVPLTGLALDEMKKCSESVKLVGEKYFSVPPREDPHAVMITDIVYGVYRYLIGHAETSPGAHVKLGELLTANASASSSTKGRRNGIIEGSSTASGGGTIMARDEFSVQVARELIFAHAMDLLSDQSTSPGPIGLASRLGLRLHVGSSAGLHQLLHVLHGITFSTSMLIDQPLSPIFQNIVRFAFAMEKYDVIELNAENKTSDESVRDKLEEALILAGTAGERIALWIDIDGECEQVVTDTLLAVCTDKIPPILFESQKIRNEAIDSCVRNQQQLRLLSSDDAIAHFQSMLRRHLRLCVVTQHDIPEWLARLMRGSSSCQWISFREEGTENPRYRSEVVRQAIHELTGQTQLAVSREIHVSTTRESDAMASWTSLYSLCDSLFDSTTQRWSEDLFLSFVGSVVTECKHRADAIERQGDQCDRLLQALQSIQDCIPRLRAQCENLSARSEQLSAWHNELELPLLDLRTQLRERITFMHEQEAELPSDDLRALQRKAQKLEKQVWAHRSMMEEYNLARTEVASRQHEVEAEVRHWTKYRTVRESVETRMRGHAIELQCVRDDPAKLLHSSVKAYSHMLGPVTQCNSGADVNESQEVPDRADQIVSLLWRARFPFLRHDNCAEQIFSVIDTVRDTIPLVVDKSALCQHILVHVFSNVPWFTDGNEEHDRREAVGFTSSGAVAPMIVQCDGGPKMWRKLHEAVQKEVPALLVGVSCELLLPLSRFAQQHAQQPRKQLLKELTIESYRAQLKRDVHQPKRFLTSDLVDSLMASQPLDDKSTRRQDVASADFKRVSAALVSAGGASRGTVSDSKGPIARRGSVTSATIGSSNGHGFQMYAITHQAIDQAILNKTGHFARFEVDWHPRSSEAFFTESGIRRHDKKLHKDLVDARRVDVDSTYAIAQAEEAVWPITRSPTCISPMEREEFMARLEELETHYERRRLRLSKNEARLAVLELRVHDFDIVGKNMVQVARAVDAFALAVSPNQSQVFVRSHRLFEQLLEVMVTSLLKHDQASSVQQSSCEFASRIAQHVTSELVHTVLTSLPSESHKRVFLLLLANEVSNKCVTSFPDKVPENASERAIAWILWHGCATWSRTVQLERTDGSERGVTKQEDKDDQDESSPSVVTPASSSTALSLVERLRHKVRICSLIFEHIGNARNNTHQVNEQESKKRTSRLSVSQTKADQGNQNTGLQDAQKTFRGVARVAKTLWCEWKLAKEDQHADLRRALLTIQSTKESRPVPGSLRRKHHSVKDMTLAATSVTQNLTLDDLAAQYLGFDGVSESRELDKRLGVAMVAKAYFPQLFVETWDTCVATLDPTVRSPELSTSQLLGLDYSQESDAAHESISDLMMHLSTSQQLPTSIDVAWRRDDLVHLPTRVLLYDATTERTTVDVLMLRASDPAQPNPLRLFLIVAWDDGESRLEAQLTAAVTSKERLAVEISSEAHFNRIVAMMSNVINQHALLCIPEWYVITTIQAFERLSSPATGYLRVHVVKESAESVSITTQLSHWLISNTGLSETDADTAAPVLLRQAGTQADRTTPSKPLTTAIEALTSQLKIISQSGEHTARQCQMKQTLLKEMGLDEHEPLGLRSLETRGLSVLRAKESLEFLSDISLFPSQPRTVFSSDSPVSPRSSDKVGQIGLPPTVAELCAQLETICEALDQNIERDPSSDSAPSRAWRSLMANERSRTAARVRALLSLLRLDNAENTNRQRAQDGALVRQGLVPVDWLVQHFPTWSDACFSNVISVAQVLVLLVSRLGFVLYNASGQSPLTLNLSLLDDPRTLLRQLRERYVAETGCDPGDVVLELQPGVVPSDESNPSKEPASVSPVNSFRQGRRTSQALQHSLNLARPQINRTATETCIVVRDDGLVCGIQVDGLVVVERVLSHNSDGTSQVFLHDLPVCRLVCRQRPVNRASHTTAMGDDDATSKASKDTERLATAQLHRDGVRLTTITSTSPFQTLQDNFWGSDAMDEDALLARVVVAPSLLHSVPSLTRVRPEHDSSRFVLAVPMLPVDDDDQDA